MATSVIENSLIEGLTESQRSAVLSSDDSDVIIYNYERNFPREPGKR